MSGTNVWLQQPTWFIDPASGNDEATGVDAGHPIKTCWELLRRWGRRGSAYINQATTVTITSSIPTTDVFDGADIVIGPSGSLSIGGTPTTSFSGAFTGVTAINRATQTMQAVADTGLGGGWGSRVGSLLRNTNATRLNASAWVVKDLGSSTARTSRWAVPTATGSAPTVAAKAPVVADTYNIVSLPTMYVGNISITSTQRTPSTRSLAFQNLVVSGTGLNDPCAINGKGNAIVRFGNCKLVGVNMSSVFAILQACYLADNTRPCNATCGSSLFMLACASEVAPFVGNSYMLWDLDTIFQATAHSVNVDGGSVLDIGTACMFDGVSSQHILFNGKGQTYTLFDGTDLLWGSNTSGQTKVVSGGSLFYTNKPTMDSGAGIGREITVGITPMLWSDVPAESGGARVGSLA